MNKINPHKDNTKKDLQDHGVQDIVPNDEEYYTLNLKRGQDTDLNDDPELEIAGNDPLADNDYEILTTKPASRSSNAGGVVNQNDIVDQDNENSAVPGEPGHWGVDEDTG